MSPREVFAQRWRINLDTLGYFEHLIVNLGLMTAIFVELWVSSYFVSHTDKPLLVTSIGASTVLLFTNPHGEFSQPWAIIGGHFISGLIGIICYHSISDANLAAAIGVCCAVIFMKLLHCLHPPGAATLLTVIFGSDSIHALGYQFLLTPVLINTLTLVSIGILCNYLFSWRRYPLYFLPKLPLFSQAQ